MHDLNHENLVRFIGICPDEPNLVTVTELCTRGSLRVSSNTLPAIGQLVINVLKASSVYDMMKCMTPAIFPAHFSLGNENSTLVARKRPLLLSSL